MAARFSELRLDGFSGGLNTELDATSLEIEELAEALNVRIGNQGEVQRRTGTARSTLSHHLHRMIAVGLVRQRREGTTLHCSTDYQAMAETIGFLTEECCVERDVCEAGATEIAMEIGND